VTEIYNKLTEKASIHRDKLTENRIPTIRFIEDDPYLPKSNLSKVVAISIAVINCNNEIMRGKYLRRV